VSLLLPAAICELSDGGWWVAVSAGHPGEGLCGGCDGFTYTQKEKTLFSTCQTFLAVYHDANWVIVCYGTHRMRKPVFCLETTSVIL